MIGDVVGQPGRRAVGALVPELRRELGLDFVIANGENAAAGRGLTAATAHELLNAGVDVITSGNHIFAQKDIIPYLDGSLPVLRPANYPPGAPGRGMVTVGGVTVLNLIGRTFLGAYDDPFRAADALLEAAPAGGPLVVDFHAEATSEKVAMGWYLDGRVTAVLGTHTHVPTADLRVLPGGTAYVTDVGMVGAARSVIGNEVQASLRRFLTGMPERLSVAEAGPVLLNAVLVETDGAGPRARSIIRVDREYEIDG